MTTYAGEIDKRSEVRKEGAFKVIQGIQHVFRLVYGSQSTKEFRLGFTSMISPPVRILLCATEGFAYKARYWGGNVGWNTDPEHHKKNHNYWNFPCLYMYNNTLHQVCYRIYHGNSVAKKCGILQFLCQHAYQHQEHHIWIWSSYQAHLSLRIGFKKLLITVYNYVEMSWTQIHQTGLNTNSHDHTDLCHSRQLKALATNISSTHTIQVFTKCSVA